MLITGMFERRIIDGAEAVQSRYLSASNITRTRFEVTYKVNSLADEFFSAVDWAVLFLSAIGRGRN
jgi:hypothetical protein